MYYATKYDQMYHSKLGGTEMDELNKYYEQTLMIEITSDHFQNDIALIIVLYLFEWIRVLPQNHESFLVGNG